MIFLLVFSRFGVSVETLGYWAFLSWLLALALIDLDTMTLPNALTQSGLVVGLGFQFIWGWGSAPQGLSGAIPQLIVGVHGAVLGIWLFETIAFLASLALKQEAMGSGDSKLAAMLGVWLGWKYLLVGSFLACALGAFLGGGAIALGWIDRRQPIPFGPFLALGAALTVFWGEGLLRGYWGLFFPLG
jgi:leader peptidase (prepilin peptidase)/N-methyltransferase